MCSRTLLSKILNMSTVYTEDRTVMVVLDDGSWHIGEVVHENKWYIHLRVDGGYEVIYKRRIRRVLPDELR